MQTPRTLFLQQKQSSRALFFTEDASPEHYFCNRNGAPEHYCFTTDTSPEHYFCNIDGAPEHIFLQEAQALNIIFAPDTQLRKPFDLQQAQAPSTILYQRCIHIYKRHKPRTISLHQKRNSRTSFFISDTIPEHYLIASRKPPGRGRGNGIWWYYHGSLDNENSCFLSLFENRSNIDPKWVQDGPNMGPNMGPRWTQK